MVLTTFEKNVIIFVQIGPKSLDALLSHLVVASPSAHRAKVECQLHSSIDQKSFAFKLSSNTILVFHQLR